MLLFMEVLDDRNWKYEILIPQFSKILNFKFSLSPVEIPSFIDSLG